MDEPQRVQSGIDGVAAAGRAEMGAPATGPLPPFGYFERLEEDGGWLHIAGWLLWHDGAADRLVLFDELGRQLVTTPVPRPDLAAKLPWLPNADRGGFAASIPSHLVRDGMLAAGLRGERAGRSLGFVPLRWHRARRPVPRPPPDLFERITLHRSPAFYHASGLHSANDLLALLGGQRPLESLRRWLDFGCGCGRQTVHLLDRLSAAEGHGVDRDAECIDWLRANVPGGTFRATGAAPPLPYGEGTFDAVFATAVFTHMPLAEHRPWLAELHRVLAPGGKLVTTAHGTAAVRLARQPRIAAAWQQGGCCDAVDDPAFAAAGEESYFRATYQTVEHVRATCAPWFEVSDHAPGALHGSLDVFVLARSG